VLQVGGRGQRSLLRNYGILNFLSSKFRHGSASPELMTLHKFEWSANPALVSVRQDTEIVGKCLDFEPVVKSMPVRFEGSVHCGSVTGNSRPLCDILRAKMCA
jgi:hypothetical protein